MIQGINYDGFINRLRGEVGRQQHISCGDGYDEGFTNIA